MTHCVHSHSGIVTFCGIKVDFKLSDEDFLLVTPFRYKTFLSRCKRYLQIFLTTFF